MFWQAGMRCKEDYQFLSGIIFLDETAFAAIV